ARLRSLHTLPTRRSSDLAAERRLPIPETHAQQERSQHGARQAPSAPAPAIFVRFARCWIGLDVDAARAGRDASRCSAATLRFARSEEHTSELQSRENLVC